MSMNLIWRCCNKSLENFEFQTQTELTYKVLDAKSKDEQFELIKEELEDRIGAEDRVWLEETLERIKSKLYDKDYRLEMI